MTRVNAVCAQAALLVLITGCRGPSGPPPSWEAELDTQLPVMGHRNFIVVADSAYPQQSSPGITTIYTGQGQIETVRTVLAAVDRAAHVDATIYLDAELDRVPESDAPGITAYRRELAQALGRRPVVRLEHLAVIEKLAASGELFTVLVLKTDLTLPYTSVFLELGCGYWDAEREERLRSP